MRFWLRQVLYVPISSRLPYKQEVGGSIPSPPTHSSDAQEPRAASKLRRSALPEHQLAVGRQLVDHADDDGSNGAGGHPEHLSR
jgi:hypothetical protein